MEYHCNYFNQSLTFLLKLFLVSILFYFNFFIQVQVIVTDATSHKLNAFRKEEQSIGQVFADLSVVTPSNCICSFKIFSL